jgi:hypothetical protein
LFADVLCDVDPVAGTKHEARAAESQAIGRAHRQGQTSQVTIVRFIVRNTIEYDSYVQNYVETEAGTFHSFLSSSDN